MGMGIGTEVVRGDRTARRLLLAGAALCLIGAGGLLWWRDGAAIFTDVVSAALSGCF